VHGWYAKVLGFSLAWRKLTLAAGLGAVRRQPDAGADDRRRVRAQTDDGFIQLKFKTPVGSSLDYTDAKVHQVEDALKAFKEIANMQTVVGTWDGRNTSRST
jgi:multidrug efflux pump subunit AcrB